MRKHLIGVSAAAAVLTLAAGCGNDDPARAGAAAPATSAVHDDHGGSDRAFAQQMIPHHRQAVAMADLALERAADPRVRELATRIKAAQAPEIRQLGGMLERWDAPTTPGTDHGAMPGGGMMTEEEMSKLGSMRGAGFDTFWVRLMIRHHEGAVRMARTQLASGTDGEATALARRIVAAQEAEIRELRALLPN